MSPVDRDAVMAKVMMLDHTYFCVQCGWTGDECLDEIEVTEGDESWFEPGEFCPDCAEPVGIRP